MIASPIEMLFWICQIPYEGLYGISKVWNLASVKVGTSPDIPNLLFYYIFVFGWNPHHKRKEKAFAFLHSCGPPFHKITHNKKRHVPFFILQIWHTNQPCQTGADLGWKDMGWSPEVRN